MTDHLPIPIVLPSLRGERLTLRAMDGNDASALLAIYGDALVMKSTDEAPFTGLETVGLMLESVHNLLADGAGGKCEHYGASLPGWA